MRSPRTRGVTLIEVMIVVVIVGVLALLAVIGYRRWVRTSYVAEANDMVTSIRAAEEGFAAENGAGYLDVSGTLGAGYSYPLQHPSNVKTAWGGPCGWCAHPWTGLTVQATAPVIFGYSVIANQTDPNDPPGARITNPIYVTGGALVFPAMNAGTPWYFVEADANISGDTTSFTHVYGMSWTNTIYVMGDGN